jgi:hypothetical protein
MRDKMAGALGMALVAGLLSASSPALADGAFLSIAPLVADVNDSPGLETVAPRFTRIDTDADGAANRLVFRYDIYNIATHTKSYSTKQKTALYPDAASMCPIGVPNRYVDADQEPVFIRDGKWVATAVKMNIECPSNEGWEEDVNTFIYIADVSGPTGTVRSLLFKHAELVGAELHDVNGDGTKDLMLSMIKEKAAGAYLRIYAMELSSGNVLMDESYLADLEK